MSEALPDSNTSRRDARPWRRIGLKLGLALVVVLVHGLWHGLRFPPLQYDPGPLPTANEVDRLEIEAIGAYLRQEPEGIVLRAFSPEPQIVFSTGKKGWSGEVLLENIHPEIDFLHDDFLVCRPGLTSHIEINLPPHASTRLELKFPPRRTISFAVIGDGGGRGEIAWCFKRASDLNADFVLHLGDIAYNADDFASASRIWNESDIPIFTAVGNHDFHGNGEKRHRFFMENFGPLNSAFKLNDVWFLNLDTAADSFPASGGYRGDFLDDFAEKMTSDTGQLIVFSHKPLFDPRVLLGQLAPEDSHGLDRKREANWLREQLLELNAQALLCGHLHYSYDFNDHGLRTLIAGEGLGANGDSSRILMGEISAGQTPVFHWELLEMPIDAHGWGVSTPTAISWWPPQLQ